MSLRLLCSVFGVMCVAQCWTMDKTVVVNKDLSNMLNVHLLEKSWNKYNSSYDDKIISAYGSVSRWIDYKWNSKIKPVRLFCPMVLVVSRLDVKYLGQFNQVKHKRLFDDYKAIYYKKGRGAFIFCHNYNLEPDDFPFINQIMDCCAKDKIEWN